MFNFFRTDKDGFGSLCKKKLVGSSCKHLSRLIWNFYFARSEIRWKDEWSVISVYSESEPRAPIYLLITEPVKIGEK